MERAEMMMMMKVRVMAERVATACCCFACPDDSFNCSFCCRRHRLSRWFAVFVVGFARVSCVHCVFLSCRLVVVWLVPATPGTFSCHRHCVGFACFRGGTRRVLPYIVFLSCVFLFYWLVIVLLEAAAMRQRGNDDDDDAGDDEAKAAATISDDDDGDDNGEDNNNQSVNDDDDDDYNGDDDDYDGDGDDDDYHGDDCIPDHDCILWVCKKCIIAVQIWAVFAYGNEGRVGEQFGSPQHRPSAAPLDVYGPMKATFQEMVSTLDNFGTSTKEELQDYQGRMLDVMQDITMERQQRVSAKLPKPKGRMVSSAPPANKRPKSHGTAY